MKPPRAPAIVNRSRAAKRAWRDLWALLTDHDLDSDIYAPMLALVAVELGLAEDAASAIYRPTDPETGERGERTLEEYLAGRNSQTAQELTVLRDALKQAAKLISDFGTSPVSQRRMGGAEKKQEESPMMQYIRAANERAVKSS